MAAPIGEKDGGVAQVVPLLRLRHLGDRRFDYRVPPDLIDLVGVGSVVTVPFRRRIARAVVVGLGAAERRDLSELRSIESVADDPIPEELVALARDMAERYLSSYESCLRLTAPPASGRAGSPRESPRRTWVVRVTQPPFEAATGSDAVGAGSVGWARRVALTEKQKALLEAIPEGGAAAAFVCRQAGVGTGVLSSPSGPPGNSS